MEKSNNFRSKLWGAAIATSVVLASQPTNAAFVVLDDWNLALSALGPSIMNGGTTYTGFSDLDDLRDVVVSGGSTVVQQLSGGSGANQPFSDSGFLTFVGANDTGGAAIAPATFGAALGTNNAVGATDPNFLYFEFIDLTGTAGADGSSITFDTGGAQTGSLSIYLDDAAQTLANVGSDAGVAGNRVLLASFDILPGSEGSGINTDGGAFAGGTVGVVGQATFLLAEIFEDENGNPISVGDLLTFIDVDATLDDDLNNDGTIDNPVFSGGPDGEFLAIIANDGSDQPAQEVVPEPETLALLGIGLFGLGLVERRRRSTTAA